MSGPGTRSATAEAAHAPAVARARRPRPTEILAAGYMGLTGLFALAFGSPSEWWPTVAMHAAVVALLLAGLPRLPDRGWTGWLRDLLPFLALPLAYLEVAQLNDLFTRGYHDREILRLEAAVFGTQPSITLRSALPWKPLSEYLHFGYFSYYAIGPALVVALLARGRREAYRYALTVSFAVFFVCYLCFVVYPVAGPWYVFERPAADEMGWVFPHLEHAILDDAASEGAAFPSSHVAAAIAVWLLAWRLARGLFRVLAPVVPALVVGTVYGGFHYGVDALAGIAVGVAGYLAGPWIYRALGGDVGRALEDSAGVPGPPGSPPPVSDPRAAP